MVSMRLILVNGNNKGVIIEEDILLVSLIFPGLCLRYVRIKTCKEKVFRFSRSSRRNRVLKTLQNKKVYLKKKYSGFINKT